MPLTRTVKNGGKWRKEPWKIAKIPVNKLSRDEVGHLKKTLEWMCSAEQIGQSKEWRGSAEPDVTVNYKSCNPDKLNVDSKFNSFDLSPLGSQSIDGRFIVHLNPDRKKREIIIDYKDQKVGEFHLSNTVETLFSLHGLPRGSVEENKICMATDSGKICIPFEEEIVYYNPTPMESTRKT